MSDTPETPRVTVIGVGNLLLRDEGFGVHVLRHLEANYRFPEGVTLVDGGTAGLYLAPVLEDADDVILVDVVALKDTPGKLLRFSPEDLRGGAIPMRLSPHQVGILDILEVCRLRERAPERIRFLAAVPGDISTGVELSPELEAALPKAVDEVLAMLSEMNIEATRA